MANVIVVRPVKSKINRGARGEGIIRIDAEATDILESLLMKTNGGITVKELASTLVKYAANDTIIKFEDGEEE